MTTPMVKIEIGTENVPGLGDRADVEAALDAAFAEQKEKFFAGLAEKKVARAGPHHRVTFDLSAER